MEIRILVRVLSLVTTAFVVLYFVFANLAYMPALIIGLITLGIFKRFKPNDVKPYFYLTLAATIVAAIILVIQGISGVFQIFTV